MDLRGLVGELTGIVGGAPPAAPPAPAASSANAGDPVKCEACGLEYTKPPRGGCPNNNCPNHGIETGEPEPPVAPVDDGMVTCDSCGARFNPEAKSCPNNNCPSHNE